MSGNFGAIILAAGEASRFGAPKQLLQIDGIPLIDRACQVAADAGCGPILRVLGAHADEILARPCPLGVMTEVYPDWRRGMGCSLAAGTRALLAACPDPAGIFILLPDQPLVTADLLAEMRHQLAGPAISAVICGHHTVQGPPALFRPSRFAELLALTGDRGAKSIATRHPEQLATVQFPGVAQDIDTPEAWARFLSA